MRRQIQLSSASKLTVAALVVATAGVVLQMLAGVPYPTIPPVFFIQLVPAALIAFGRWPWAPATAVVAGLFLTLGLFSSGASVRLFDLSQRGGFGGSLGLWIQMIGVILATMSLVVRRVLAHRA